MKHTLPASASARSGSIPLTAKLARVNATPSIPSTAPGLVLMALSSSPRDARWCNYRAPQVRAILGPLPPAPPHALVDRFVDALAERSPEPFLEDPVGPEHVLLERIVDLGEAVLRFGLFLGAQLEPGRLGLVLNPPQREIRQGIGRMLVVAPTDVRVRADEPLLLDRDVLGLDLGPDRDGVVRPGRSRRWPRACE